MARTTIGMLVVMVAVALLGAPAGAQCVITTTPDRYVSYDDGDAYIYEAPSCDRLGNCGYGIPSPTPRPPISWGLYFGNGTWYYEETNGLQGLQRGGFNIIGGETPGCGVIPCLVFDTPVDDETCGAGPDRLVVGADIEWPPASF